MSMSKFVWYDLATSDLGAAETFYRNVIGWDANDSGMDDRSYTIFSNGTIFVAGLMPITEACEEGMQPCWSGYVGVDDVDVYAKRLEAAGGKIHRAPEDIPGVGRFAVAADPQGAGFILFTPADSSIPQPETRPDAAGHIGWHELTTSDHEQAFAFYSGLFGWTKTDAMDMGPMGIYQMFATGGEAIGGMMNGPGSARWLYYINVDAIDECSARVLKHGGKITNGPQEVPGPMWVVQCMDPQGAHFAMVAPTR